jgi:Fe-S cluster assembly protein SufD
VCKGDFSGDDLIMGITVNEWTHTVTLPRKISDAGVILMDLEQAIREHEELVEPHFARQVPGENTKFEALNLAAWHGGFLLYLPRGVVIDTPVHLFMNDNGEGSFFAPRVLVVMESGSKMTLFNEFTGQTTQDREGRQLNSVIEIVQGEGSRLQHVIVQRLSKNINSYLTSRARLERDANLHSVIASFGSSVSKVDTGAVMVGPGAESELVGFAFGEANQHLDHHSVYDHQAAHTRSQLNFKVVLKEKARSAFTGLLRIARDAPGCEAFQENRNILLSDKARVDIIPELEILTDDVKCSHGATAGPIDSEQIYYLMSRGIPEESAIRMVVAGFLEPTLAKIPGDLQGKMRRCVEERLREF